MNDESYYCASCGTEIDKVEAPVCYECLEEQDQAFEAEVATLCVA